MNSHCERGKPMKQTGGLFCTRIRCGLLSITTTVKLLANEFDVRIVLHGQVSLAVANHIYVFREAMNGCKYLKIR